MKRNVAETSCRRSQAALCVTGLAILALTAVRGANGYTLFVWIYGLSYGGYVYALKMYIYEKVRARNFARAWGFAQCAMGLPNLIGVPVTSECMTTTRCQ